MYLTLDKKGTLYDQIARAIKLEILEGRIVAGARLPSTRALATALGVARKSVLQAYELLCAEELAIARGGSGTRVAIVSPATRPRSRAGIIPVSRYAARMLSLSPVTLAGAHASGRPKYNLLYGEPLIDPGLFHSWRRKLAAAALRAGPTYPAAGGYLPLRRAIADYLVRQARSALQCRRHPDCRGHTASPYLGRARAGESRRTGGRGRSALSARRAQLARARRGGEKRAHGR